MNQRRLNALRRYEIIQKMVGELYEPGNQSRSKMQAYRQIQKSQPLSERTFWRIMGTDVKKEIDSIQQKPDVVVVQSDIPFDFE